MEVCHKFHPFRHIPENSITMLTNLVMPKVILFTIKTITMKSIFLFIILALLSLIVHIEVYYGEKVSSRVDVSSEKAGANPTNGRTKALYPITFGSSFIVIDERMVYCE